MKCSEETDSISPLAKTRFPFCFSGCSFVFVVPTEETCSGVNVPGVPALTQVRWLDGWQTFSTDTGKLYISAEFINPERKLEWGGRCDANNNNNINNNDNKNNNNSSISAGNWLMQLLIVATVSRFTLSAAPVAAEEPWWRQTADRCSRMLLLPSAASVKPQLGDRRREREDEQQHTVAKGEGVYVEKEEK